MRWPNVREFSDLLSELIGDFAAERALRWKPETVNWEPRSLTNTNGLAVSRCNRREARNLAQSTGECWVRPR